MNAAAEVALTLDVDWAPDWAVDLCAGILRERNVRATWFVTHAGPALERLREDPELFELGIHPNFLDGSTHGTEPGAVLEHCMGLVPDAVSMRAHSLGLSSSVLHAVASATPIEIDVSIFLPYMPGIRPVLYSWEGETLVRLPYYWEDDHEMELRPAVWDAGRIAAAAPGIKVINFHPIHVYLNSSTMEPYRKLGPLQSCSESDAARLVESGTGARTVFEGLVDSLAGGGSWRIAELRERFPELWPIRDHPLEA